MNISSSYLDALKAFGYTEEEARFLYIVATHSGYFVARQFLGFTGSDWGKRTTTFWAKLHAQKHARTECFPKSGVIYHLFSRRLYRQIGRENLRNRREHEIEFIRQRIAILDFASMRTANFTSRNNAPIMHLGVPAPLSRNLPFLSPYSKALYTRGFALGPSGVV